MEKFTTKRLVMQEVQHEDINNLHHLHSIPEIARYNTYNLHQSLTPTIAMLDTWLNDQQSEKQQNYIFTIKLENEFVGIIALMGSSKSKFKLGGVWYLLLPKFWGMGIATESLQGMLKFAFEELKLHRIEAGAAVNHIASHRVMEKVGMIREGHKRKVLPLATGWSDNFEYAILEEDWFRLQSKLT